MSVLRKLRVDSDLTVQQLAEKSGVSEDQIRNIEFGHTRNPRVGTLRKLADALGAKPSDIDPLSAAADRSAA